MREGSGKRAHVLPYVLVIAVFFFVCIGLAGKAAASQLYDIALDYVAENNWDMALYAFEKLRTETRDPEESALASLWTIALLKGLGDGELMIGQLLGDAVEEAVGDDKGKLLERAIALYESGLASARRTVPLVTLLLSDPPPRRLTVVFARKYNFPSDGDLEGFRAKLCVGLFPGSSAVERELRPAKAAGVAGVLGDWSDSESLLRRLIEGYCSFDIDLVKIYAHFGLYFDNSDNADEARLARRCLEKVVELTESEPYCKERLEAMKALGP